MTSETKLSAPSAIDITTLAWESPAPPDILPFDWHPYASEENWREYKRKFPRKFRETLHPTREKYLNKFLWPLLVIFTDRIPTLNPNERDHRNLAAELTDSDFIRLYKFKLALFLKTVFPRDSTQVEEKALRALQERSAKDEWIQEKQTERGYDMGSIDTLYMTSIIKILSPENFSRLSIPQAKWDKLKRSIKDRRPYNIAGFGTSFSTQFELLDILAKIKILFPDLFGEVAPNANEWSEIKTGIEHIMQLQNRDFPLMLTHISNAAICAAREVNCTGNGRLEVVMSQPTFAQPTPKMPVVRKF